MPDPLTNLEIQDVLSSIRRLVSEDNRHRAERDRARQTDAAAPAESGKLVLTEALRVAPEGAPEPDAPAPGAAEADVAMPDAAGPAAGVAGGADLPTGPEAEAPEPHSGEAFPLDETVTGDARFAADDALPAVAEAEAAGDDTWEQAEEDASLEGTIAELEAAVAGFGGEFEPDGSEVARTQGIDAELEEAFEESFAVDLAAEEEAAAELAALSQPVTAGAAEAAPVAAPPADAVDVVAGDERAAEIAAATGDAHDGVAEADETAAESAWAPDDAVPGSGDDRAASLDPFDLSEVEDTTATLVIPAFVHSGPVRPAVAAAATEPPRPAGPRRLTLTAAQAVPADQVPWGRGGAPATWPEDETGPEDEIGPGDAPGLASALAEETGEAIAPAGDEAERSTFDPGDEGVIDMAMLRDLVAEIIREELQGPLGERITRNVRMLVRREINRALEARGLD